MPGRLDMIEALAIGGGAYIVSEMISTKLLKKTTASTYVFQSKTPDLQSLIREIWAKAPTYDAACKLLDLGNKSLTGARGISTVILDTAGKQLSTYIAHAQGGLDYHRDFIALGGGCTTEGKYEKTSDLKNRVVEALVTTNAALEAAQWQLEQLGNFYRDLGSAIQELPQTVSDAVASTASYFLMGPLGIGLAAAVAVLVLKGRG